MFVLTRQEINGTSRCLFYNMKAVFWERRFYYQITTRNVYNHLDDLTKHIYIVW